MNDLYFWLDGAVVIKSWEDNHRIIRGVPCIDTNERRPKARYGYFKTISTGWDWHHTPFSEFPPLFRMHLLLLGVS